MEIPETHKVRESDTVDDCDSTNNVGRIYKELNLEIVESGTVKGCLKCLLISDGSADKSGAAMTVAVGQMHDPMDAHGIAHLTEHMLFMGSAPFPSENDYDSHLSRNGGYHNAYTDLEMTNYYFECSNRALEESLHRFAAGFTSPLLRASTVEREINAIDSEHAKNKQQDSWRIHQLSRTVLGQHFSKLLQASNQESTTQPPVSTSESDLQRSYHPYGSFGTGNKATLLECIATATTTTTAITTTTTTSSKDPANTDTSAPSPIGIQDTMDNDEEATPANTTSPLIPTLKEDQVNELQRKVKDFYDRFYTVDRMALAVMGNQSIDDLQAYVTKYFSNLPTKSSDITEQTEQTDLPHQTNTNQNHSVPLSSFADSTIPPIVPLLFSSASILPAIVEVVPVKKEGQSIEFQWIVQEQISLYRSKPLRYFSHLLGHEGSGSLLAALRELHYAQELYADDGSKSTTTFCIFTVNIELTELGLQNINTVISMTLYYIQYVITADIPTWVYDELRVTGDTQFRFLSKQGSSDTVCALASQMQFYKPIHYLSGPYKIFDHPYNPTIVRDTTWPYLSGTSNLLIIVSSIQFQGTTDQLDPWYGTQYRILSLASVDSDDGTKAKYGALLEDPKSTLDPQVSLKLKLPELNDMLPTNFDLIHLSEQEQFFSTGSITTNNETATTASIPKWLIPPRCLINTGVCRLWYKPDTAIFFTPKVNVLALLQTPACNTSPVEAILSTLYVEIISEVCNEFAYAASMAGLHCGFGCSSTKKFPGIEIHVSGYNHKVDILLHRICDAITKIVPLRLSESPELFYRVRDKIEDMLAAVLVGQPYQYSSYLTELCLETGATWTIEERMECIQEVTVEDFLGYTKNLLKRFRLELLVHGNVTSTDAIKFTNIILSSFQPKPPLQSITSRVVQLPVGIECNYSLNGFNPDNDNSCIVNLYQVGVHTSKNPNLLATLTMLNQLIREPAFNQLRTEEQLGYVVFTNIKTNGDDIKSLMILIQSDSHHPQYMNERIETFLVAFRKKLVHMTDDEYQTNTDAVVESILEKNKHLSEESSKHWQVITSQSYRFLRHCQIADVIPTITKQLVLQLFDKYVLAQSSNRRKLSIQIHGKNHLLSTPPVIVTSKEEISLKSVVTICDPAEFVRTQPLYATTPSVSMDDFMLSPETTTATTS